MLLSHLRQEYTGLRLADLDPDPLRQFAVWLQAAIDVPVPEPNAMTLATVTPEGLPAARMVLLKAVEARGFVFYSNFESAKGQDLAAHPHAALVFYWAALERQVRVTGTVTRLTPEESAAYFASRPRGAQLGAWASRQSRPLENYAALERQYAAVEAQLAEQAIPLPPWWGGYCVAPQTIEFWQGRPNRLHDRLCYTRQGESAWHIQRLSP